MDTRRLFTWRPLTTALLIGGVLLLVFASTAAFIFSNFRPTTEVHLGGGVYQLWVAKDETSRTLGLSGVTELKPNGGLLMAYDTDEKWGIWMKNMKIPIDIIWLDSEKKVVYIVKDASPELDTSVTYTPKDPARYVIELPAGGAQQAGIKVGNVATFEIGD